MDCEPLIQATQSSTNWTSLLTLIIALIAISIAYFQWKTNSDRLKHELFDRRYEQFMAVKKLVAFIQNTGSISSEEEQRFFSGINGMRFIFDEELAKYVNEDIWHTAVDCKQNKKMRESCMPHQESEKAEYLKHETQAMHNMNSISTSLDDKFSKYLQLK